MTEEQIKSFQRTKEEEMFIRLIDTYRFEFLDLFFPWLAAKLVKDSLKPIELLPVEREEWRKHRAILVYEGRFKDGKDVILHIEGVSQHINGHNEMVWVYNSQLYEKHLPGAVLSIVVYSHKSAVDEPDRFRLEIPGFKTLDFRFLRVQLAKIYWRKYANCVNPVAAAMLSQMAYCDSERVDVKLAHMRILQHLGGFTEEIVVTQKESLLAGLYKEKFGI